MAKQALERTEEKGDTGSELLPRRWLESLDWPLVACACPADQPLRVEELRKNRELLVRAERSGVDPEQ